MKLVLVLVCALLTMMEPAYAGGSISWEEVSAKLTKNCPELLHAIAQSFEINRVGGALRLGPRSIDVIEGRAEVGTRVPPFEFDCKVKGSQGSYNLRIEINDLDDGWKFILRTKAKAEQGA